MAIQSIQNYSTNNTSDVSTAAKAAAKDTAKDAAASSKTDVGVVYEKSADTAKTSSKTQNSALIAKLKAETDNRVSQLRDIVSKMISKQGSTIGTADDMWRFLAGGNFTVSEAAKAQAQADIADDGYWGVEQTSDRILDFAKALASDDPDKADEMLNAFKKGFSQATKSWGKELPDISQRTYDAVVDKFNDWKNNKSDQAAEDVTEAQ